MDVQLDILLICGINDDEDKDPIWANLQQAFAEEFPGSTIHVERRQYRFWQLTQMQEFGRDILARHDNDLPKLVIGYSMGGVIASMIVPWFQHSRVIGMGTIMSPHTLAHGIFPKALSQTAGKVHVPVATIGGLRDWVVPWLVTRHPQSVAHADMHIDHVGSLKEEIAVARRIARFMREHLLRPG